MKCEQHIKYVSHICDLGRNGRQKGGGAKNYQAFIAGKKPNPKPAEGPKVRPINTYLIT